MVTGASTADLAIILVDARNGLTEQSRRHAFQPSAAQDIETMVCWMADAQALTPQSRLLVKHTTRTVKAIVRDLHYRLDVNTLHRDKAASQLGLNGIGWVTLRLTQPVFCDPYARSRQTGGLILIEEMTNATVGAGMITGAR